MRRRASRRIPADERRFQGGRHRANRVGALSNVTGFEVEVAFELHRHRIWEPLVPVVLVLEGAVAVGLTVSCRLMGVHARALVGALNVYDSRTLPVRWAARASACWSGSALRRPEVLAGVVARGFVVDDNRPSNVFERDWAESGSGLRSQAVAVYNQTC
jgi:hypothetical protein